MKKLLLILILASLISYCSSPNTKKSDEITEEDENEIIDQKDTDSSLIEELETRSEETYSNKTSISKSISEHYVLKDIYTFKNRFNKYCRKSKSSLRIKNITIQIGEVNNTFQYMFNDHIGLIGTLNKKDNSLKEITMIGQGNGNLDSATNILITMGGIISCITPTIKPSGRGKILREIGFFNDNVDINNLEANTKRGDIKYWINSSKYLGIMFGASNIKNE